MQLTHIVLTQLNTTLLKIFGSVPLSQDVLVIMCMVDMYLKQAKQELVPRRNGRVKQPEDKNYFGQLPDYAFNT